MRTISNFMHFYGAAHNRVVFCLHFVVQKYIWCKNGFVNIFASKMYAKMYFCTTKCKQNTYTHGLRQLRQSRHASFGRLFGRHHLEHFVEQNPSKRKKQTATPSAVQKCIFARQGISKQNCLMQKWLTIGAFCWTFCLQNVQQNAPIAQSAMIYKIKMSVRFNFAKPRHVIYKTCAFIM